MKNKQIDYDYYIPHIVTDYPNCAFIDLSKLTEGQCKMKCEEIKSCVLS